MIIKREYYDHWLPKLLGVDGIVIMKVIMYGRIRNSVTVGLRNHEWAHYWQQVRDGIVWFKMRYVFEWIIGLFKYRSHRQAYYNISYEREAMQAQLLNSMKDVCWMVMKENKGVVND
jgi:hypothetical protein